MIDEKCIGCIHCMYIFKKEYRLSSNGKPYKQLIKMTECDLDTDDDSPCFHYDHYITEIEFRQQKQKDNGRTGHN